MPGLQKEYDVIVVGGGGVNGLACAAYLQKAGLKVAVFERRDEVGTFCSTEEVMHPGVKVNIHASFIVAHISPAFEELELRSFGYEPLTSSEWGRFHPFKDKSAVLWHSWDVGKQVEAWSRLSRKDGETLTKLANYLAPHWSDIAQTLMYSSPKPENIEKVIHILDGCPIIPKGFQDMSGIEMADLMWEDERIKVALLTGAIEGAAEPWEKGTGLTASVLRVFWGAVFGVPYTAKGGSHGLPHALARCFVHYGGSLFQGCPVQKIIVENNEAKGVVLSKNAIYSEAEVRAKRAIVSNLTVQPTFIDLVGLEKLSPEAARGVKMYEYDGQVLFTTYWVLNEAPQWPGYPPEIARGFGFNFGEESINDIFRLQNDLIRGILPDPPIASGGNCQGYCMADPTQAPPGQYTVMSWCDVPYDLRRYGGPQAWDDLREEYADKVEDLLNGYMANLKRAKIARYAQSPLDNYRKNPSAIKGTWSGGPPFRPHQTYINRPFNGCNAPRTPIANLYLSNSIWPFGATYLAAGYNAACTVAEDLGVRNRDWWNAKPIEPLRRLLKSRGIEQKLSVG